MTVVNLGVEDFGDLEFWFIIDNDWWVWGLKDIRDQIQSCWFNMET